MSYFAKLRAWFLGALAVCVITVRQTQAQAVDLTLDEVVDASGIRDTMTSGANSFGDILGYAMLVAIGFIVALKIYHFFTRRAVRS